jgi:hypothetical protein
MDFLENISRENTNRLDFSITVDRLERRGKRCRLYALGIFIILMIVVVTAISLITFKLLNLPQTFKETIEGVMSSNTGPLVGKLVDLGTEGKMQKILEQTPTTVEVIVSSIFSFGVFGIFIYLMQISVAFIRYYSYAAEHYENQADALRASNGSAETAFSFIKHFSPPKEITRVPRTLHETMLNTISELAKSSANLSKTVTEAKKDDTKTKGKEE